MLLSDNGHIVEVLCACLNGGTVHWCRFGQALEWMGKMGTGARIIYTTVNKTHTKVAVTTVTSHIQKIFKIA